MNSGSVKCQNPKIIPTSPHLNSQTNCTNNRTCPIPTRCRSSSCLGCFRCQKKICSRFSRTHRLYLPKKLPTTSTIFSASPPDPSNSSPHLIHGAKPHQAPRHSQHPRPAIRMPRPLRLPLRRLQEYPGILAVKRRKLRFILPRPARFTILMPARARHTRRRTIMTTFPSAQAPHHKHTATSPSATRQRRHKLLLRVRHHPRQED